MKPLFLRKHTKSALYSFEARFAQVPHLYNRWHYHQEIELMYVIHGSGTRFVGNSIRPFSDGDLVLVGPNVPHFWQSEERYFQKREDLCAELILLQFREDFMEDLLQLPEMVPIKNLMEKSLQGIRFLDKTVGEAGQLLWNILEAKESNRVIRLLELLDLFAKSSTYELLCDVACPQKENQTSADRIQSVCSFLLRNFKEPLTLKEIAAVAHMSEKAFCRFFKHATHKTAFQFITELRISYACKLLLNRQQSVGEICFASGFNNLSNFNRTFKRVTGHTPKEYQAGNLPFSVHT